MQQVNWQRSYYILGSIVFLGIIFWATWSILGYFGLAVVILLLAMAVAFLLTPVVNFLTRAGTGTPRPFATFVVYCIVLIALGALGYALFISLSSQVQYFSTHIPSYIQDLPRTYSRINDFLVNQGVPQANINNTITMLQKQAQNTVNSLLGNMLGLFLMVTNAFINILLVIVISFYFTVDGKRVKDSMEGVAPKKWLPHIKLFEDALNRVVGNYIRGQLTLAFIVGALAGIGTWLLGLSQFSLIIGVLAFLFETIPTVGPALASLPALAISLLLPDPVPRTLYIAIYFVCIQIIESNILGPRIVGHAVGLHPVASLLALIIFVQIFGPFGALLATPIVAALWVVIASFYRSARGETTDQILSHKRAPWIKRTPWTRIRSSTSALRYKLDPVKASKPTTPLAAAEGKEASSDDLEQTVLVQPVPDSGQEAKEEGKD